MQVGIFSKIFFDGAGKRILQVASENFLPKKRRRGEDYLQVTSENFSQKFFFACGEPTRALYDVYKGKSRASEASEKPDMNFFRKKSVKMFVQ